MDVIAVDLTDRTVLVIWGVVQVVMFRRCPGADGFLHGLAGVLVGVDRFVLEHFDEPVEPSCYDGAEDGAEPIYCEWLSVLITPLFRNAYLLQ